MLSHKCLPMKHKISWCRARVGVQYRHDTNTQILLHYIIFPIIIDGGVSVSCQCLYLCFIGCYPVKSYIIALISLLIVLIMSDCSESSLVYGHLKGEGTTLDHLAT